ncbi:hypothetical protein [Bdellovibrio sp. HCB-162]|uniref:hypothetical protein n=1 Tax=Bdellovibrio sp. HCB-162 TaxID=3394234 RepID=UPI0039BD82F4
MKALLVLFLLFPFQSLADSVVPQGKFLRSCCVDDSDALQTLVNTENELWTVTHTAFEEENCQTPYIIYEVKYKSAIQDKNLDMTALEASYTPLSEIVSEALNQIGFCGFVDWKTNEKKIVTGRTCDDFFQPREGEILYNIFDLKADGDKMNLFLGMPTSSKNGKTAERRFDKLDPRFYTKQ